MSRPIKKSNRSLNRISMSRPVRKSNRSLNRISMSRPIRKIQSYADDILVFSENAKIHNSWLNNFLTLFQKSGRTLTFAAVKLVSGQIFASIE